MEIKYTNFEIDPKIYGVGEIIGLYDPENNFIYENFYDERSVSYNPLVPVGLFLRFGKGIKDKKVIFDMLSEFEISKELQKRPLGKLSTSELIKVLIIKVALSPAKTIILDSIDTYLNSRDLNTVIKTLKNHLIEIQKSVIFTSNDIDNLLAVATQYVIIKDGKIAYNGKDFSKVGVETDISIFTKLANAKGAKLKNYKDESDLLKAIYRSIK